MEEELNKLKEENEQLKKINTVKSELISIASHQLRTSLSALKWILEMFISGDLGKLSNEQGSYLQKAYNSNERMITLVNDLLMFNKVEDSAITYTMKKVDLLNLVEQALFEFSGESSKKQVEVVLLKPENGLPLVTCDEGMIRVVLQNLIENAIKYSNKGTKVFITVKAEASTVQVSVHDSGIGISEADKDNIFKKFFRAPNAVEKDAVGSGLGLFTTKNIIDRHNGKIWFENMPEGGTTFFVVLPII